MLDAENAVNVAGGEPFVPAPLSIEGLEVIPSILTQPRQLTGDDDTRLVLRYTGGRAKVWDYTRDFVPGEITLIDTTAAEYKQGTKLFASGNAVWFALVAVKHGPTAAINLLAVPGAIAAVADAVVPTFDEIKAFLSLDERASFVVCGDIRFHRSAATVIGVATSAARRPAYVDESHKTSALVDRDDTSTLGSEFWGYVDVPIDLVTAYAKTEGDLVIDGMALPPLEYGGYLGTAEWITAQAATGSGADIDLQLGLDGTDCTGGAVNLLLGTVIVGAPIAFSACTANHKFKPGATLDVKLSDKDVAFTAGSGVVRVPVFKYVRK